MSVVVSLREVIEHLEMTSHDCDAYLNRKSGELFVQSEYIGVNWDDDDEPDEQVPDWDREYRAKVREIEDSADWLALPSAFEIHEWRIMEQFCRRQTPESRRDELLDAIHGKGAFRHFKNTIHRMDLQDDWYRFHDNELAEIAIAWLEDNHIKFKKDI